jgi:branched-chain amino acid transport system substrate-binding protein
MKHFFDRHSRAGVNPQPGLGKSWSVDLRMRRKDGMGGVFAAFAVSLVLCSSAQAEILIGIAGPMTGQNAAFGAQMRNGAVAAIASINAKGGLNGELLRLVEGDDQCDVKRAVEVANQLAAQDVRMVAGHFCSNAATAAASVYAARDVVMISPSASHPKLTDQGLATTLRLAPRDDVQGTLAALRILQDDTQAVVALIEDGTAQAKSLVEKFSSVGVPALIVSIKPGERNIAAAVQKLRVGNPSAIYFACGGSDAGNIAAAYASGGGIAKLYGPDTLLVDAYFERAGAAAEGTVATFPNDPQAAPDAREVIASLQSQGQTAEGATLTTFAAIEVYAAAAQANPTATATDIAAKLKSGAKFKTILGEFAFDGKGDAQPQRYDWYRWSNGAFSRDDRVN